MNVTGNESAKAGDPAVLSLKILTRKRQTNLMHKFI